MSFIKEHILFLLILSSCVVLRLIPLTQYQFTLDEWSGLDRTRFNSLGELIEKGVKIDAHPAFVQVLLYYLVKFFGFTTWIIKLPFLLFSFGLVTYSYTFCLRNFSKQAGLVAAAIFSFSLIYVYYAPIARMYISGAFFSMALLYHFYEIFFRRNHKTLQYFFLGLFALLSALNQHINALFALTVCFAGLAFLNKSNLKPYLITCTAVVLLYLPHLPVTLYQLGIGGVGFEQGGWLPVPEPLAVFRFIKVVLGTGRSYFVALILIVLAAFLKREIKLSKKQILLLALFFVNYLVIYLYSAFSAPVFQYSVMLFSSTALVLVLSSLMTFKNKYFFGGALGAILLLLCYKTYFKKDYLHQSVQNVFEFQFDKANEIKNLSGGNSTAIFFDADTLMREVCFTRGNYSYDCKLTKDSVAFSLSHYNKFISSLNSSYLVLGSADPLHQALAKDRFPYLIHSTQTQGVNVKVYSKTDTNSVSDDLVLHQATFKNPGAFTYDKPASMVQDKNDFSVLVDSVNEYPFGTRARLGDISQKEGQVLLAGVKIKSLRGELKGVQLCIGLSDEKTNESYYFAGVNSSDFVMDKDSFMTLYSNAFLGTDYYKIRNKAKVTVFIWNTKKEKFVIRSLDVKTIDYWNRKWNLWE